VIAALENLGIEYEFQNLLPFQAAQQLQFEPLLIPIINQLGNVSQDFVLVLDDYHLIHNQQIHQGIVFFLDHLPDQFHLVLISRADPPLPLARMRARRQLTELRAAELRFTTKETRSFFQQLNQIQLTSHQITALKTRTEGWIAGLQLLAISIQEQNSTQLDNFIEDFTGSHRYVVDYLAEEVFNRQSEAIRKFLLKTAILDRFTAELCNTVAGINDGHLVLDQLDKTNLFLVPLDEQRGWYRYHHLFADFLREQLSQNISSETQAVLHHLAIQWFESNGFRNDAVEHALIVEDWETVVRLIHSIEDVVHHVWQYQNWQRWFSALPESVLEADPSLCIKYTWILILGGRAKDGEYPLKIAEAKLLSMNDGSQLGEVYAARAMIKRALGDLPAAIQLAQMALSQMSQEKQTERYMTAITLGISLYQTGKVNTAQNVLSLVLDASQHITNPTGKLGLILTLGLTQAAQGKLHQAKHTFTEAITGVREKAKLPLAVAQAVKALVHYEWNDLEKAADLWQMWSEQWEQLSWGEYFPKLFLDYAQLQFAQGQNQAAFETLDRCIRLARRNDNPVVADQGMAQKVIFWLQCDNANAAEDWVKSHPIAIESEPDYRRQHEYLAYIRVLVHQATPQSLETADQGLTKLLAQAEADGRQWDKIRIQVLKVIRDWRAGQTENALTLFKGTLTLAEPQGYMRTFIDEGPPIIELLTTIAGNDTTVPEYVNRLLEAARAAFPLKSTDQPSTTRTDALSDREIEVLQCLAAGQSNQEAAEKLVLSIHTVRTHVKNIYRKLAVNNRVQAVEKARQLGIL